MAGGLCERGIDVTVFCGVSQHLQDRISAQESYAVRRVKLWPNWPRLGPFEAICAPFYAIALGWHLIRNRYDVVTAATYPPVVAAAVACIVCKLTQQRFIYHVQDVHPEVSQISHHKIGRGWLFRILRMVDNLTLRFSYAVVTLSHDMAQTLKDRGLYVPNIHVINNFCADPIPEGLGRPASRSQGKSLKRIIYAGNLGNYQNLPNIVEGLASAAESRQDIEVVLMGQGKAADRLKARWEGHPHVLFLPHLPPQAARATIAEADAAFLSLGAGMYRVSYPSKLFTYLDCKVPVLAFVESESCLSKDIRDRGWGVVCDNTALERILPALDQLLVMKAHLATCDSAKIRNAAISAWMKLLEGESGKDPAG